MIQHLPNTYEALLQPSSATKSNKSISERPSMVSQSLLLACYFLLTAGSPSGISTFLSSCGLHCVRQLQGRSSYLTAVPNSLVESQSRTCSHLHTPAAQSLGSCPLLTPGLRTLPLLLCFTSYYITYLFPSHFSLKGNRKSQACQFFPGQRRK